MSETIGTYYFQLAPSTEGIGKSISKALGDEGEKSSKSFGSSFGSSLAKGIGTVAKVGVAALGAASTAAVGFGASAVMAGKDFDAAMSQVAATSGKSIDEIQDLRDFAQEMGSKTAFSATQAAEALNYMALAGYDSATSMAMLPNVLNLAAAGGIDLAYASDMVTDASSALGLDIQQTSVMVDQMAMAASKSNTSVSQLGEAILTIGATARGVRGGTTELSTILGVMADNGIKGAEGGTHLRNMILSLQNPTKDAVDILSELNIAVYDDEGAMRSMTDIIGDLQKATDGMSDSSRDAIVSGIFNKTDLASVNALLNTSMSRFDELSESIAGASSIANSMSSDVLNGMIEEMLYNFERLGGDTEQFASEMQEYLHFEYDLDDSKAQEAINTFLTSMENGVTDADALAQAIGAIGSSAQQMANTQLNNLAGDITLFQSALEGAKIAISDSLTPTLREFVQFGSEGLATITEGFKSGGLEGAMEAFGTVLSDGLNLILDHIPSIIDAGMSLMEALGQGLIDNSDKIFETITTVVENILTKLVENTDSFVDGVSTLITKIVDTTFNMLPLFIEAIAKMVKSILTKIGELLPTLIPTIVEGIILVVQTIIENLPLILEGILTLVKGLADGIIAALPILIDALPDIIIGIVNFILQAIPQIILAVVEIVMAIVRALPDIIMALVDALPEIIEGIIVAIVENLPMFIEAAVEIILGLVEALPTLIITLIEMLPQIIVSIVKALVKAAPQFVEAGKKLLSSLGEGFKNFLPRMLEIQKNIGETMLKFFRGLIDKVKEIGQNIMNGLSEGLKSKITAITDTVKNIGEKISEGFKSFFGIHSPSTLFAEYGQFIDEGLANGISDGRGVVTDAMDELNDSVVGDIQTSASVTYDSGYNSRSVETTSESKLYDLLATYLPYLAERSDVNISLEGNTNGLFNLIRRADSEFKKQTGQSAFA